jgi:serine/threonine-protein kinase
MEERPKNRVLAQRYVLERQLGQGSMGAVWVAEDTRLRRQVAVKILASIWAGSDDARGRFEREAYAAARLRSPHIVQIFDYGIDEGMPFIVMERLVGETLGARLSREKVLEPELVATIFAQVCRAVQKAHDGGIVHRDLKPENVFLGKDDDVVTAKVLDFGIAKALKQEPAHESTATGVLLGSPLYMSPEQAHGGKEVDHRSDLWSLAVIAFECLVGRVPFHGQGWGELVAQICRDRPPIPSTIHAVPEGFDTWFSRATERDPERRFQSCRELVDELRQVLVPASGSMRLVSSIPPAPISLGLPRVSDADPTVNLREPFDQTVKDPSSRSPVVNSLHSTTGAVASSDRPPDKTKRKNNLVVLGLLALVAVGLGVAWSQSRPNENALGQSSATGLPEPSVSLDAAAQPDVPRPATPAASASAVEAPAATPPVDSTPSEAKPPVSTARAKPRVVAPKSPESSATASTPTPKGPPSDILRSRE